MPPLPTEPIAFPFETCDPLEAAVLGKLAGLCRKITFDWDGRPALLRFEPRRSAGRGVAWVVGVELEGHFFDIGLGRLPEISWIAPELAGLELEGLPQELGAGILQVCLESVLSHSGIGLALKVLSVSSFQEESKSNSLAVGWSISRGDREGWMSGILTGDVDAFRFLESKVSQVPPSPCRSCDSIPVVIDFSVGSLKCSADDIQSLEINDVLMGEFSEFLDKGVCRIVAASRPIAYGKVLEDGVSIAGFFSDSPDGKIEGILSPDIRHEASSSIEMSLDFVIDRRMLSVSQLSNLQLGSVIGGAFPKPTPVSVVCSGQKLASGELIPVGGRNGLRITRLFKR